MRAAPLLLAASAIVGAGSGFADVTGYTGSARAANAVNASYEPTARHIKMDLHGFDVYVSGTVLRHSSREVDPILALVRAQLAHITVFLPAAAVASLRSVSIWISRGRQCGGIAQYHPDAGWLRDNGLNPDMGGSVELCGTSRFLEVSDRQPAIVLHELAHAYHHRFLKDGFDNAEVLAAYDAAMAAGLYQQVLDWDGDNNGHYAATSRHEFFAELTEAYFATNDAYPFVRPELEQYDPDSVDAMEAAWGLTTQWSACELEGEIRSRPGARVEIEVANVTNWPRRVQWIDYDGERDARGDNYLAPGASASFRTFENHPAAVLSNGRRCLAIYTPGRATERIEISF